MANAIVTESKRNDIDGIERSAPISRSTPVEQLPEFLRVEEFAAYMDFGRGLAYEVARTDPRFRAVRFGRLLRIPRAALMALAKEQS